MKTFWTKLLKGLGTIPIIYAPTSVIISCSTSVPSLNWDDDKTLIDEIKGKDFLKNIENLGAKEKSTLTHLEYQATFFLYDKEQKGSIELQKMFFEWQIFLINQEIFGINHNMVGSTPSKVEKETIEDKEKDKEKIQNKIKIINEKTLNYTSSSFASNYPKILMPQSEIQKKKEKIFKDTKDDYIFQFSTEADGKEQWPEYRRGKYNGAITDNEAITYLVYQETQNIAFSRFVFKLNTSFTKEMAQAMTITTKGDTWTATPIFSFLQENVKFKSPLISNKNLTKANWPQYQTNIFEDEDKASNAYFVSSNTKIPLEMKNNPDIQKDLLQQHIIQVQNIMVPGKPDDKNSKLPWTVLVSKPGEGFTTKSSIKRILHSYKSSPIIKGQDLIKDLFQDKDKTEDFVQYFSSTLDSTRTKSGKLGIQPAIQYVKDMVPAFGFGILKILGDPNPTIGLPVMKLDDILSAYNRGLQKLAAKLGVLVVPTTNDDIDRLIDSATDEDINKIWGQIIRDVFVKNKQNGISLVYKVKFDPTNINTSKAYIIVSEEFGIHIIHINKFASNNMLSLALDDDLTKLAKDQSSSNDSTTSIWTIYTKYYNQIHKLNVLAQIEDFKAYFIKNYKKEEASQIFIDAKELIKSTINSEASVVAKDAIGTKTKSWYISKLDSELRKIEKSFAPDDFYQWAYKLAGGK